MAAHTPLANRQHLVTEWRSSGTSATTLARQHGIVVQTFRRWITETPAPPPTFIEVLPLHQSGPHAHRSPLRSMAITSPSASCHPQDGSRR